MSDLPERADSAHIDFIPIALKAMGNKDKLFRAWQLIKYVIDAFMRVAPELIPLLQSLFAIFVPKGPQRIAESGTIVITVQVRALQHALGVEADGVYGPATEEAVRLYQTKHNLFPDGWFGLKTLVSMGHEDLLK